MPQDTATLIERRRELLGPNLPTFYDDPVHLVKGEGVWLWDADGRKYLDCYNNVPHVGHCHPHVVEAITRQASTLNTPTRYLHDNILDYVERLTGHLGSNLSTAILTCTGSEANDIALRMAQAATGKIGIIATDDTYHGNTWLVSQVTRHREPIGGRADWVRFVPAPDSYRPMGEAEGKGFAETFTAHVKQAIHELEEAGHGVACFILDPYFANEGFPTLPSGFLDETAKAVRAAGGILIADEVQPGFGRTGTHMWGHEKIGLAPEIVTTGKPMANGHPVGSVVSSPEILSAFRETTGYFNTFGGNPVSCAAAIATLDVLENENLMANAQDAGSYALERMAALAQRYEAIGNVRGSGLFFGAELVKNRETREPDAKLAEKVSNAMRHEGILLNRASIHHNTLKVRPPMPFGHAEADLLVETLDKVLGELTG